MSEVRRREQRYWPRPRITPCTPLEGPRTADYIEPSASMIYHREVYDPTHPCPERGDEKLTPRDPNRASPPDHRDRTAPRHGALMRASLTPAEHPDAGKFTRISTKKQNVL